MKTGKLTALLLILFFCFSCKKEEFNTFPYLKVVNKDGNRIADKPYATLSASNQKILIAGYIPDPKYYQGESLKMSFNFSDISLHDTIRSFNSKCDIIVGGDAVGARYSTDIAADNFIQISLIDTISKRISGTFSVQLIQVSRYETDGILHLNIKPLFWSGGKQISGDKIEAYFNTTEQNIDSLKVIGNAFAINKVDSLSLKDEFHQIKGKLMTVFYENNEMKIAKVTGNAEAITYADSEDAQFRHRHDLRRMHALPGQPRRGRQVDAPVDALGQTLA